MIYSTVSILALVILIIENGDILLRRGDPDRVDWVTYRRFLTAVGIYYLTDIFWGFLSEHRLRTLLFLDTSLYFVFMAAGVLLWTRFAVTYLEEKNRFGRYLITAGRVFAASVAVLVVLNFFVPLVFTIDGEAQYHQHVARYGIFGVQFVMLLLVSGYTVSVLLRGRCAPEKRTRYEALAYFGFIMAVLLYAQLWFPLNPLYAVGYMLGTCMLRTMVILEEEDEHRRGKEEAQRVSEMNGTLTTLLNNMPAMSFYKDAETGVYLACNQTFVEYAHRESPSQVLGLTDRDIFDPETAAHFIATDREAAAMEKPYVYSENVADALGNLTQLQTTKLKFTDAYGRLCILGMCTDITESERIKRESAQTKAAYEKALSANALFENMVEALSRDYFNLYYVDLETGAYVEYGSRTQSGQQTTVTRGTDFFSDTRLNIQRLIYEEDQARVSQVMTKERLLSEIDSHGIFHLYYRLIIDGRPTFVEMKATRLTGDQNHLIIGINNVDRELQDRRALEHAREERKSYRRLLALNGNILALYVVDMASERYTEFSASRGYEELGVEKQGEDFFETSFTNSLRAVYAEDQELFHAFFTKENILSTVKKGEVFVLDYRIVVGAKPLYVRLKAAMVEEENKPVLIVGILDVDAQIRQEEAQNKELTDARRLATRDGLTGVRNKQGYVEMEEQLNAKIHAKEKLNFAVVVCDLNDLKHINDTAGHREGDRVIQRACAIICHVFGKSPVFRVGGDEFAVICQGEDYDQIDKLLRQLEKANAVNRLKGDVQIAYGMARYRADLIRDPNVGAVFERADRRMYDKKAAMK